MTVQPQPGQDQLESYDEALPQVYGYLLSRCGSRAVAEDLTSETFLAAVTAVQRGTTLSTPWLIGTARHKLVDHWRRLAREERGAAGRIGRRSGARRPVGGPPRRAARP